MDPALDRLVARAEIVDLIARYAITFDDQDWEALADLFTEDASFVVDEAGGHVGRADVLGFLSTCLPAGYVGKHFLSVPLVEIAADGRSARSRTDVVWFTQDFATTIIARYDDDLVRGHDGRWRIRRRHEKTVPYREGSPPMSDAALALSRSTMHQRQAPPPVPES